MSTEYEETVEKLAKLILTSDQKMVREEDLKNLCPKSVDFDAIINEVYYRLGNVGFELISSKFLNQKFYILTSEGKNDEISPSQYGTLALILALNREVEENMNIDDLKEIFSEVWTTDVEYLIQKDYLRRLSIDDLEIIKVTPLGKATLKNIIENLNLDNLLEFFNQ
ncbi:MAG: hypothetical protein BAJALOKI2v1_400028 [Promethearchaeota archaeon]|nr:MAG: hypothetical protein BAJALOKI2v1_400028 [Candidatus Lokiarchaeota archaeon]